MCVNKICENHDYCLVDSYRNTMSYIPEATFRQIGCSHEAVMTSTYDYGIIIIPFGFGAKMP